METWAWLVAYVLGFGLLQLLLYRYFQREDPSPDVTPGRVEHAPQPAIDGPNTADSDGVVQCPHCGTPNQEAATYAYCRECAHPLQG
jgi:hypothetical protein